MYDLVIIGGGPAGLSAAVYAARYNLKTLVLSKDMGGVITKAHDVCNWPGEKSISGIDLMNKWAEHATSLGVEIKIEEVKQIKKEKDEFLINTKYKAKSVLLTMGTTRRKLNVPGEKEYIGKGVSYCATCDAAFYKGMTVAIVGGNDSACSAATMLRQFAKKVYIIYRKEKLRAEPFWVEKTKEDKNIEIINNANVTEVYGEQFVTGVKLDTGKDIKLEGVFIEIGAVPSTALAEMTKVQIDDQHYVIVNENQETNVKGIYAAGD